MGISLEEYAKLVAGLQQTLRELKEMVSDLRQENAELRRMLFGQRRERIQPMEREVGRADSVDPADKQRKTRARRAATAERQAALPEVEVVHPPDPAQQDCGRCGGPFRPLGEGEVSHEFEYVPGRFVRWRHVRQRSVCRCGATIVVAAAPARVGDGVKYGPGLHAHVAVAKCADSMPLYRLAKSLRRAGVPITPSSLGDVFHRTAELLRPLAHLVMQQVAACGYVNADETPVRVMARGKTRRAYAWAFLGDGQVAYRYSPSRSGDTPRALLAEHRGYLQVDNYTGYNKVCTPDGWTRVGCLAHVRRYFYEAQQTEPEAAAEAMARILEVYRVEHAASQRGIVGSVEHLAMRQQTSRPIMEALHAWLTTQRDRYRPKSPMGKAIVYALNGWQYLLTFLDDPKLTVDNNASERALRVIALGRKNFLFVGNDEAGENLAVLQTLVGCCDMAGVNPQDYLADVLIRIQAHPAARVAELLPKNWQATVATSRTTQ